MAEAVAALIGAAIGVVGAILAGGRTAPWSLVAAVLGAGAALLGAPGPAVSLVVAGAVVAAMVDIRWATRPAPAHRLARRWDRATVRRLVAAESVGRAAWAVPASVATLAFGTAAGVSAVPAVLAPVVPIAAWMRSRGRAGVADEAGHVFGDNERVVVIQDTSADRSRFERVVEDLAARGHTPAVAVSPPHLFRGLAGWNLGLGLGAEQAGWAGQLARSVGLESVLAEPESSISSAQARMLAVCRALAAPGDVVVLDEPAAGLEPHEVKTVAAVVERALAGRPLIVVTSDVGAHQAFAAKVRSRT